MTDAVATRDQPLIAIDVVPVSFSAAGLLVATARRQYDPYAGQEALPGVLLHPAERLTDAARRALRTKAGIGPETVRHLAQIGAFDGPERDPRDAAISIAFVAVVDAPAAADAPAVAEAPAVAGRASDVSVAALSGAQPSAVWRDTARAESGLPFDHDRIIQAALDHARTRLWRDTALMQALLGPRFTTADASRLQTAVTGSAPDPGNLNRALRTNAALVRADESAATPGRRGGRPPVTWTWRA